MEDASVVRRGERGWVDARWFVRLLEIIPGTVTWAVLVAPVVFSLLWPVAVAYFIIAFDLYWTIKSFRLSANLVRGYRRLHLAQKIDWRARLEWLHNPALHLDRVERELAQLKGAHPEAAVWWRRSNPELRQQYLQLKEDQGLLLELKDHARLLLDPDKIYHALIVATYNESRDILEPTIKALAEADYPLDRLMLIIAYEERGGEQVELTARALIKKYGKQFALARAIKHPRNIPGEVMGKGGNISFAGRKLTEEVRRMGIHPECVVVTTLDSDNRAAQNYFNYLTYAYASDPNRVRRSFQPIPMYYNNIWDAPAPMRVIATGTSFWNLMEMMRPHRLRNFASHAQPLAALIATDYWSVTSIVEDGHQYWRTYFAYNGDHRVVPIYTPVFQDAVLAESYLKTIRAQYKQMRRWAYGVSDFPYVVRQSIANRQIPWSEKIVHIGRLFEGHFSWATSALLLTTVAWMPLNFNRQFASQKLAYELPTITSHILQVASAGIVVTVLISLLSLPPRPARYRKSRHVGMILQWVLLPVTTILFGSFAAIDSQTRLALGRYLEFYVTEKAVKK